MRGDDLQPLVARIYLTEGADKARLLHFNLLQDIRHHFANLPYGLRNGRLASLASLVIIFVELVDQLRLRRNHVRAEVRAVHRRVAVS